MAASVRLSEVRPSTRAISPMFAVTATTTLLICTALGRPWYLNSELRAVALASVLTAAFCFALVVTQFRRHLWAFAPMLLFLIVLFHVGLFLGPTFTGRYQLLSGSSTAWVETTEMRLAIWFVGLCVEAFALGASMVRLLAGPDDARDLSDNGFAASAAHVGSVVLIGSVAAWFITVIRLFGPHAFQLSYLDFFQATRSSSIAYVNLGIALGLVLVCLNPTARASRRGLVVFAVFAVASMSIGARSTTMFAAAAGTVVLAYRIRMPRPVTMVPIVLGVVSLLGLIRVTRLYGILNVHARDVLLAPLTGFAELGYTVRVVQTSFYWHGVLNEPIMNGGTYFGWPARVIQELASGSPPPTTDFRLMNVEISTRIGGLGGSILAEAHHNFGVIGGLLVAFGLGLASAWASRRVRTTLGLAVLGVVAVPIFIHVRNSFAPVVFTVICGLTLLAIAHLMQRRNSPNRS